MSAATRRVDANFISLDLSYRAGGDGGVAAPLIFGRLIESGSRQAIFGGYVFAACLMFAAAVVAWLYAINAERKSLEEVAAPLSAIG